VPFNASKLLSDFFAPLIVIAINFLLIPTLIQISTLFEDHYLYSEIQHSQLWRIFFFMLLNVLLIPITEATTALALMDKFEATDAKEWPTLLSSNMMAQQYVFLKLIIQLTFVTNGLTLLDAPHRIMKFIGQWLHEREQSESLLKTQYRDEYEYDLGYNQSYVMVIFLICLLFSAVVPIISVFAWAYFAFKYRVDKYNLVFLYYRRFESGGSIRQLVKSFMLFNIFLYMFVMVSFYGYKFADSAYYWLGIIITILWAGAYHYVVSNSSSEHV
jgi:calcium permeable stress-gated cation channel